jgi:hypothetical protein
VRALGRTLVRYQAVRYRAEVLAITRSAASVTVLADRPPKSTGQSSGIGAVLDVRPDHRLRVTLAPLSMVRPGRHGWTPSSLGAQRNRSSDLLKRRPNVRPRQITLGDRSGVQPREQRQDAWPTPARLPRSGSQARAAHQSGSSETRTGARGAEAEPGRGQDHRVFGVDALRLPPRHLVRLLDWIRG